MRGVRLLNCCPNTSHKRLSGHTLRFLFASQIATTCLANGGEPFQIVRRPDALQASPTLVFQTNYDCLEVHQVRITHHYV